MTIRKERKIVNEIKADEGISLTDSDDIINEFTNYFNTLFQDQTRSEIMDWEQQTELAIYQ